MYQGFETKDPRALVVAQGLGLLTAWVVVTAFAVTLFIQALYQSSQAAICVGVILALLVLGPVWSLARGRAGIDPLPPDDQSDVTKDLVYRS